MLVKGKVSLVFVGMLLRFQWQIQKLWQETDLDTKLFPILPLPLVMNEHRQIRHTNIRNSDWLTNENGSASKENYKTQTCWN